MSKLRSVIRHEYLTIVKQPSFWIIMVAIPAIIAVVFALNYFSNSSSSQRIEEIAKAPGISKKLAESIYAALHSE